jgi:hypothetical protein
MRSGEKRGKTKQIGEVIPALLGRIEKKAGGKFAMLAGSWPEVVGEEVGRHTEPVYMRGGRLTIEVDDAVWMAELSRFHRGRIIEAVNSGIGERVIQEVLFRPKRGRTIGRG